jgi:CDP-glycerol glycerophosphotransferase (TagB/SpsB family)
MDNSRTLFEWYNEHGVEGQYYWMTKSHDVYRMLKSKNLPVARIDSVKGIRLLNKAKYAFYTNRLTDIAIHYMAVPTTLKLIYLSHGQSVKNTRLAVHEGVDSGYRNDTLKASSQMAFAISTSPFMAKVQAESNGLSPEMYKITGFPRNDWMFNPPQTAATDWARFLGDRKYSKVILYAPTWRRNAPRTKLFPFSDFDPLKLARFVEEHNILLLLRPHLQDLKRNPHCKAITEKLISLTGNIRLATIEEFVEASFLLPYVDALISDYSSIYHDFLLLDRPIYLVPYDHQTFDQVNGFKYPYLENLPGPVVDSQEQLFGVFNLLVTGVDHYRSNRENLRGLIYTDVDGNACERVAKQIA